jgi:tRNA 2-thiouridine synthesizing protein A
MANSNTSQPESGSEPPENDILLDVTGFNCPIPVLKARRAARNMAPGQVLTVLASDPASMIDFKHFCNTTGNELLDASEADDVFTYIIRISE